LALCIATELDMCRGQVLSFYTTYCSNIFVNTPQYMCIESDARRFKNSTVKKTHEKPYLSQLSQIIMCILAAGYTCESLFHDFISFKHLSLSSTFCHKGVVGVLKKLPSQYLLAENAGCEMDLREEKVWRG